MYHFISFFEEGVRKHVINSIKASFADLPRITEEIFWKKISFRNIYFLVFLILPSIQKSAESWWVQPYHGKTYSYWHL